MRDYSGGGDQNGRKKTKKTSKPATRRSDGQQVGDQWAMFSAGFVLGALTVGVAWVVWTDVWQSEVTGSDAQATAPVAPAAAAKKPKLEFDFPQKLKQLEVVIPDDELDAEGNRSGEPLDYYLQLGSFLNPADADRLKADVAFLGHQALIVAGDAEGRTWHRVRLGPFPTRKALHQVRSELRRHDIQGIVLQQSRPE